MKILHIVNPNSEYQIEASRGLMKNILGISVIQDYSKTVGNKLIDLFDDYDVIHCFDWEIAFEIGLEHIDVVDVDWDAFEFEHFYEFIEKPLRIISTDKRLVAEIHKKYDGFNHQCIPVKSLAHFENTKPAGAYESLYRAIKYESRGVGYIQTINAEQYNNTVISFGGLGQRFTFWNIMDELKAEKIFVRDCFNMWYQDGIDVNHKSFGSASIMLSQLVRLYKSEKSIFIGDSAGGLGAIQFGHHVGADIVLAFNPQTFVNHDLRKKHNDNRWKKYADEMIEKHDGVDLFKQLRYHNGKTKYYIFYSTDFELDKIHAKRMRAIPGVTLVPIDCDHHGVAGALKDFGMLNKLLKGVCEENDLSIINKIQNVCSSQK